MAIVGGVVLVGGLVTGVTGFGYAVFATATLASLFEPETAVVLVILPIVAANLSLVRELDRAGLRSCVSRFWPFVGAAAIGTVFGMAALSRVPTAPLTLALGVLTLGYVGFAQPWVRLPFEARLATYCLVETPAMKGSLGFVSGLVFGGTNVGVQVIAYLESLDLDHATFVGVVAMIFLGIGGVRIATAWALGLYGSTGLVVLSAAAAIPGLLGVALGKRLRPLVSVTQRNAAVYLLLVVIGTKLTADGLSAVL
jgi:uncharacterized membrane protein YfcA